MMERSIPLADLIARDEVRHEHDFGPVILARLGSITLVNFGLFVGGGSLLALMHTLFYFGYYPGVFQQLDILGFGALLAFGVPLGAYLVTRLLDFHTVLRGQKTFLQWVRTISFGFWGGLFSATILLSFYALRHGIPGSMLLDAAVLGLPLAHAVGRLGCLNYGCCHGRPATGHARFTIRYRNPLTKVLRYDPKLRGRSLIPTQLYSALGNLGIYLLLIGLFLFWPERPVGLLAATWAILYGLKRFIIEHYRGEFPRVYWMGLTVWQWFSLVFMTAGILGLVLLLLGGTTLTQGSTQGGLTMLLDSIPVLLLTALILAAAYTIHGREIGKW